MENKKELIKFIKRRKHLIWYVKDYGALNAEAIVEATLNYGDWDDVQKLIKILGIKKMAKIFRKQAKQKRCNYAVKTKHYFGLYFKKYA
ncbi:MAG: hypothetical protein V1825_01885 [Candidatus Falkowbacteria bacterium]